MSFALNRGSVRKRRTRDLTRQCLPLLLSLATVILLISAAVGWYVVSEQRRVGSDPLPEVALHENEDLRYGISQLEPGRSRLFSYPVNSSERVRLLITRDLKGVIRASFAFCGECYSLRHQNYMKEGALICGRCQQSMRMVSMRMGEQKERIVPGQGCVTVPIPFSIGNDEVVVRATAIVESAKVFLTEAATNNGRK